VNNRVVKKAKGKRTSKGKMSRIPKPPPTKKVRLISEADKVKEKYEDREGEAGKKDSEEKEEEKIEADQYRDVTASTLRLLMPNSVGLQPISVVETATKSVSKLEMEIGLEELFPPEVIELILRNVDELSWPCCQFVCRRWREILDRLWQEPVPSAPTKFRIWRPKSVQKKSKVLYRYSRQLALAGWLSVLQWARDNGCPWDEDTCAYAAEGGHLSRGRRSGGVTVGTGQWMSMG
jgi:hypothetical protein